MGQEFFINSQELETKVRQLLPSQGGAGQGFDLSASTQIVPIIDLTESAEGSNVRQDLQTALSFKTATTFNVSGANTVVITTTGYFRIVGTITAMLGTSAASGDIIINDGASDKIVFGYNSAAVTGISGPITFPFDFTVFLEAGHQLEVTSSTSLTKIQGSVRQIADIDGNLTNP